MSFVYHPSLFYNPFLQSICPIFPQPDLQNQLTSLFLSTFSSENQLNRPMEQFEPILISSADTFQQISSSRKKNSQKSKNKVISRSRSVKKDENFGGRNQSKDRNVISNILKGYVNFILQHHGQAKQIQRICQKAALQSGVSDFYQYMSEIFQSRKSYVGLRFIQQRIKKDSQRREMAHILGVTLHHYLKMEFPLSIVQDVKLKKKARIFLLRRGRTLLRYIFDNN